jgi:hypothetical protein
MFIRPFPSDALARSLVEDDAEDWTGDEETPTYTVVESGPTGKTWDSGLTEGHYMVFTADGTTFYRAEYRQASAYYLSEVGEQCEPFTRESVDCTEMVAVPSVKYVTRK